MMGGGVRGAMVGFMVVGAACGAPRPTAPMVTTVAPHPMAERVEDFEGEWHTKKPAPLPWSGKHGSVALYPVASGYGCQRIGAFGGDPIFGCGRSVVRFASDGASLDPFRAAKLHETHAGEVPSVVFEREGELWMDTKPLEDPTAPRPYERFSIYRGSTHHFGDGRWTSFPTVEAPERVGAGWLVFDLPRLEKPVDRGAPGCADFGCANVLPKFWAANATAPDFASFDGKLAWIHPYDNEEDYAYVVEADGAAHVLLRVLDRATQRRSVGVLSWSPATGARFVPLPAFAGDAHFDVAVERPKSRPFRFLVRTWKQGPAVVQGGAPSQIAEAKYAVHREAQGWSVAKLPPAKPERQDPYEGYEVPRDGPEVGGYRMNRGNMLERKGPDGEWELFEVPQAQLMLGKKGDVVMGVHYAAVYHSVQPKEALVLTDSWGDLHPWPEEATDDCATPFAVFDALDPRTYAKIVETGRAQGSASIGEWGVLPRGWTHLVLVEFRLFDPPLVVIGAPLASMKEAKLLREQWEKRAIPDWANVGLGGERNAKGVYCARPVKPKPFALPF